MSGFTINPGSSTANLELNGKTGADKTIPEVQQQLNERRKGYKAFFNADDRILTIGSPTVITHLKWLSEAGFDEVDCLEKHSRSAIIGGFRHNH